MVNFFNRKRGLVPAVLLFMAAAGPLFSRIKVEPAALELPRDSGEKQEGFFRITQTGPAPVRIRVTVERFGPGHENPDSHPAGLSVSHDDFLLNPGEEKSVAVSYKGLSRPALEQVYMVYFAVKSNETARALNFMPRYGRTVYLAGSGGPVIPSARPGRMAFFKNEKEKGYGFSMDITNTSHAHIVPYGFLIITDSSGEQKGYIKLAGKKPLFRGESGSYRGFWPQVQSAGVYSGIILIYNADKKNSREPLIRREFGFMLTDQGEIREQ